MASAAGRPAAIARCCASTVVKVAGMCCAMTIGMFKSRGKATSKSDVDVAIRGDVDVLDLAARLVQIVGREVDVVPVERAGIPLLAALMRRSPPSRF